MAVEMVEKDFTRNNAAYALVAVDKLQPSGLNPRRRFDEPQLQELADSIKEHGILEPIVARPVDGRYSIICGERRWKAAQLAGVEIVPVRVLEDVDDRKALELALVENLCRTDIDPIEEAEGYQRLRELGYKQIEIGEKVKRSQEAVSNSLRLLKLPEEVQEHISSGVLSASHGRALVSFVDYPKLLDYKLEQSLRGAPVKEIEQIGWSWPAVNAGAMAELSQETVGKEAAEGCKQCPARRKNDGRGWLCLDADCANAKVQAESERRIAAARKKAGLAEDEEMPRLEDLSYGSYQRLDNGTPEGCREDCEHRGIALGWQDSPVAICLDPKCYKRLCTRATKAENAKRREDLQETHEAVKAAITEPTDSMLRKAAVVALWPTIQNRNAASVKTAAEHVGLEIDLELLTKRNWNDGLDEKRFDHLLNFHALDLVRLAAEADMLDELAQKEKGYGSLKMTEWFVKEPEQLEPTEQPKTPKPKRRPARFRAAIGGDDQRWVPLIANGATEDEIKTVLGRTAGKEICFAGVTRTAGPELVKETADGGEKVVMTWPELLAAIRSELGIAEKEQAE